MKPCVIVLLSLSLAAWLGLAHADNNAAPAAATQAGIPNRGTLYRVRHHGNTSYLFGTIHVGKPAFFPLEDEVTRALSRASKLVLEIDIRKPEPFEQALHKHGIYPVGETIDRHLSPDTLTRLKQALQAAGIPFDDVRHMKPWLLANMLVGLDLERNGYLRSHGIEIFLLLREDETTFVGVGLLHMVGETGVPTLLRQRGYEVEKLY